jgi:hypothetical protein
MYKHPQTEAISPNDLLLAAPVMRGSQCSIELPGWKSISSSGFLARLRIPLSAPIKSQIDQHLKPPRQIPGSNQRWSFYAPYLVHLVSIAGDLRQRAPGAKILRRATAEEARTGRPVFDELRGGFAIAAKKSRSALLHLVWQYSLRFGAGRP